MPVMQKYRSSLPITKLLPLELDIFQAHGFPRKGPLLLEDEAR